MFAERPDNFAGNLLPYLMAILWVYMLYNWYLHATQRRTMWLIIILLTGAFGYVFFILSKDHD